MAMSSTADNQMQGYQNERKCRDIKTKHAYKLGQDGTIIITLH